MTYPPAFWILMTTGALGIALLVYERRTRRVDRHFTCFAYTGIALIVWMVLYAFELGITDPDVMLPLANAQFVPIAAIPLLLHQTVRQFLGRRLLRARFVIPVAVIPAIGVVLALLAPEHPAFRETIDVVTQYGMVQFDVSYGWFHNAFFVPYQYAFYIASLYLLLRAAVTSPPVFRGRLAAFAVEIIIPITGAALYILNVPPLHVFNPSPILLMVSFLLFGATMLRHHRLDVVPVARHLVLDTLEEGIIVLDLEDRIVDFNRAAAEMFDSLNETAIGSSFLDSLGKHDAILALARGVESSNAGFVLETSEGTRQCIGRAASVIGMDGTRIGRVITAIDITERS
ncbi:MAG: histidine kinase N-terminal 7TM domain-containing protein [Spirochaetota bacterium]